MRLVASLLLSILCAAWTEAEHGQHLLERGLRADIEPCDDFYKHTCNMNDPAIKDFAKFQSWYLVEEAAKLMTDEEDVMIPSLARAFRKTGDLNGEFRRTCRFLEFKNIPDVDSKDDYLNGKFYGELNVYGRFVALKFSCSSKYRCKIEHNKGGYEKVSGPLDSLSPLYRGLVDGYFEALNITVEQLVVEHPKLDIRPDLNTVMDTWTWWEYRFNDEIEAMTKTFSLVKDHKRHRTYLHVYLAYSHAANKAFIPYFNVLYSVITYRNPLVMHPEMAEEFERLAEKIVDEICLAIESSDWIKTAKVRERLIRDLRKVKIHVGIPKIHRNLRNLTELLRIYNAAIADKERYGFCELEMISRAVAVTRNRLVFERGAMGTVDQLQWFQPISEERSLYNHRNAFHSSEYTISANPSLLHFLRGNYSLGFKYGYAGFVISHELFHHLGIRRDKKKDYLAPIIETDHFMEAQSCYYEHYGSFCFNDECPDGNWKADEGYCDVEGLRVIIRVLRKALGQWSDGIQNRTKRAAAGEEFPLFGSDPLKFWNVGDKGNRLLQDVLEDADEVFKKELKWLFYGLQHFYCQSPELGSELNHIYLMYTDEHPRATIRIEAAIRQIMDFTEVFQCKKGDANYVLPDNQICEAYPLITKTTTETPEKSWTDELPQAARPSTVAVDIQDLEEAPKSEGSACWNVFSWFIASLIVLLA